MASAPQNLLPWFQIASTIIAAIGIIASTKIGLSALNASRRERREKILPNLLFTPGGEIVGIQLIGGRIFPGRDVDDPEIAQFLDALPAESRKLVLELPFGTLTNFGSGLALNATVGFAAQRVETKGMWRDLSLEEKSRFEFSPEWNEAIPMPSHVAPEKTASIGVLPAAICFMYPAFTAVAGTLLITCKDTHGAEAAQRQAVTFAISRGEAKSDWSLAVTFGDRVEEAKPQRKWSFTLPRIGRSAAHPTAPSS